MLITIVIVDLITVANRLHLVDLVKHLQVDLKTVDHPNPTIQERRGWVLSQLLFCRVLHPQLTCYTPYYHPPRTIDLPTYTQVKENLLWPKTQEHKVLDLGGQMPPLSSLNWLDILLPAAVILPIKGYMKSNSLLLEKEVGSLVSEAWKEICQAPLYLNLVKR
jgi:hypothetical protein